MGLLGKADQTLVQGSRLYAQANVPGDMSKIYKAQAAIPEKWAKFAQELQTAWDGQFEEWHNFEETMAEGFEQVARNVQFGKTNDYMIAEVRAQVDRIKNDMKTLNQRGDKGNFEWVKLEGELNKLVLTTKDNNEAFNELVTQGQNKALQIMGSGNELKLLEAIMFDYNNNANTTNQTYVDGDIEYSLGDSDISMTFSDLKRKLKIKDNTAPLAAGKIAVEIKKDIAGGGKWDSTKEDDTFNKFLGLMETPNDRSNLIHSYQPGLKYSIFEYVTGVTKAGKKIENTEIQTEIFDALISIGTDIDKDGRPDSIDTYLNVKNAMALQEEILNGRSGKNVIAGILTRSIVGDVEEWAKQYKVKNTPGNGSGSGSSSSKKIIEKGVDKNSFLGKLQTKAPDGKARAQQDNVIDILNGQKIVEFDNGRWELQSDGRYMKIRDYDKKDFKIDHDKEEKEYISKSRAIQMQGPYGNITDDYFDIISFDTDPDNPGTLMTPNKETSKYQMDVGGGGGKYDNL